MAVSIDERVVEMRFNNKQFEEGVKKSMKSLDDLDQSIDKLDENGLDDLQKKFKDFDVSPMEKSLNKLEKRFSNFGIVGATVLMDLTRKVEEFAGKMLKSLTKPLDQIKHGGWQRALNIENAKFQLKGLGVAWEEVGEDIKYAVSGTAYGLDAAANAASQLVASGVEFGETFGDTGNSPMAKALRGISGVAAMTNASYEEIAHIFTSVAGQGKLMTMQLRQLEQRGLNAAATIGQALGVSEGELRDMVTKGVIDFQTFSEAMDDAFGQHAKDANETFTGSLKNINAALSRIGADVATEVLQDMVGVFNDIRIMIDNIHETIMPLIEEFNKWIRAGSSALQIVIRWLDRTGRLSFVLDVLQNGLISISQTISDVLFFVLTKGKPLFSAISAVNDAVMELLGLLLGVVGTMNPLKVFISVVITGLKVAAILIRALVVSVRMLTELLLESNAFKTLIENLKPIAKVVLPAIVAYLVLTRLHLVKVMLVLAAITAAIGAIAGFDLVGKLKKVVEYVKALASTIKDKLLGPVEKVNESTKESVSAFDKIRKSFTSVRTSMVDTLPAAAKLSIVFGHLKDGLMGFVAGIKPSKVLIIGLAGAMTYTMTMIARAVDTVATAVKRFNPLAWLGDIGVGIMRFLKNAGRAELIKSVALALGVLTASIAGLALVAGYLSKTVNPGSFTLILFGIAAALGAIGAGLTFITAQVGKFMPTSAMGTLSMFVGTALNKLAFVTELAALSAMFLSIGAFFIIVSKALKSMAKAAENFKAFDTVTTFMLGLTLMTGVIVAGLIFISSQLGELQSSGLILSTSVFFLSVAEALKIYALAMLALSKIKWNKKLPKTIGLLIGGLITIVAGAAVMFALFSSEIKAVSGTILGVVATLGLTLVALWALPKIILSLGAALRLASDAFKEVTVKQIAALVSSMKGFAVAVGVLMVVAWKLARPVVGIAGFMLTFVGAVAALLFVMSRLNDVALDRIQKSWTTIGFIMAGVTTCMLSIMAVSGLAKNAARAALLLISIPISMVGFVGACWILKKSIETLDLNGALAAISGIISIIATFGTLLWIANKVGSDKTSWMSLLALTSTIVSVAVAIGGIAWIINDFGYGKTITAMIELILSMVGVALTLKTLQASFGSIEYAKLLPTILSMIAILGSVATALWVVSNSNKDWRNIASAGVALAGAIATIGLTLSMVFKSLKLVTGFGASFGNDMKTFAGIAVDFLAISASMLIVSEGIKNLAKIGNIGAVWNSVAALSSIMTLIGAGLVKLSDSINTVNSVVLATSMVMIAGGLTALALGLAQLAKLNQNDVWSSVGAISVIAAVLTGITVALSAFSQYTTDAVILIGILSASMLVLSVSALTVAGAMRLFVESVKALVADKDSIAETMQQMGTGFGEMISGFFAGLAAGLGPLFTNLGKAATKFLGGITKIFTSFIKNISKVTRTFNHEMYKNTAVFLGGMLDLIKNFIIGIGYAVRQGIEGLYYVGIQGQEIGEYVGFSIANGMTDKTVLKTLEKSGIIAAQAVEKGVRNKKDGTGVNSPSEKYIEIGKFVASSIGYGLMFGAAGPVVKKGIDKLTGTLWKGIVGIMDMLFPPMTVSAKERGEKAAKEVVEDTAEKTEETIEEEAPSIKETLAEKVKDIAGVSEEGKKSWLDGLAEWFTGTDAQGVIDKATQFCTDLYEKTGIGELKDTLTNWDVFDQGNEWTSHKDKVEFTQAFIDQRNKQRQKLRKEGYKSWDYDYTNKQRKKLIKDIAKSGEFNKWAHQKYRQTYDTYDPETFSERKSDWLKEYIKVYKEQNNILTETEFKAKAIEETWKKLNKDVTFQKSVQAELGDSTGILANLLGDTAEDYDPYSTYEEDMRKITEGLEDYGESAYGAGDASSYAAERIAGLELAFGRFDRTVTTTMKGMTKDLSSNIKGMSEWYKGIQNLIAKGAAPELVDRFIQMGWQDSYSYVATLNNASKKQFKKYSKQITKAMGLSENVAKGLEKSFIQVGEDGAVAYNKAVTKKLKEDKSFKMGKDNPAKYVGKKLKEAFRLAFGELDTKTIQTNTKGMTDAMNKYIASTGASSQEASAAFKTYIQEAYLASLDESQRQSWLGLSAKNKAKAVEKWWKQEQKAVEEATLAEMRSMGRLSDAYTQTGKELIDEMNQQNKDYVEAGYDRMYAYGLVLAEGHKKEADYMKANFSEGQYLSFLQGYNEAIEKEGTEGGKAYIESFVSAISGDKSALDAAEFTWGALLDEYRLDPKKDTTKIVEFLKSIESSTTKAKKPAEILIETLNGIKDGLRDTFTKDNTIMKSAKNIGSAFKFLNVPVDKTAVDMATDALEQYALTLIDVDALREEAAQKGLNVQDLIKSNLENAKESIKDFKNSIESSLKSALQSFNKFDEGEKQSFEDMEKNLESNVTKLNEWRAMMKKMQQMGYSKDIIEYMASQGINSYAEVAAMTAAGITSAQIDHVNQMWEQVDKQSEIGADEALGSVAIAAGTAGRDTVDGVIAEVEDEISKQNAEVSKSINDAGSEATNTIKNQEEPVKNAVTAVVKNGSKAIRDTIKYLQGDGVLPTLIKNAVLGALPDDLKLDVYRRMTNVGTMVQLGFVNGITSEEAATKTRKAGKKLANGAILGACEGLGVASPSKVFKWIGEQTVEGFALGFGDNVYRATDEVDELSNSLIAYAQRLSDDLANTLPTEDEWTIKPVLDLDELQNAHSLINSMLGNGDIAVRSSTLASQTATQSEWSMLSKALSGVSGETTNNTYGDTQIIINPPQGSNSREIAQMVMGEIQRQMDRRQRI